MQSEQRAATVKVVVATTVMLSFISFWRAAAIVLSDLASSAYYAGGIAETENLASVPPIASCTTLYTPPRTNIEQLSM